MTKGIEVAGARKRFGPALALDGLSFSVSPGDVTGFVGPNGAGKSTTMRAVLGLDALDEGSALIGGRPYASLRHPLSQVGSLLDAAALHPARRARDHLLWLAHSQGLGVRRVDEVIGQAGLESVARRKAGGYSLGMRQRLGLAAAMLGDPPVLILDEPFNGLDPEGIVWMRGFLRALAAEGRAVLVSSHLMSELEDTASHLVVIGRGRLVADTSVAELIATASGGRVALRTSARAEAMAALADAGAIVAATGADTLTVTGLGPDRVVTILSGGSVPFSEVSAHRATLEEAYMELTRDDVEFPRRQGAPMTEPYQSPIGAGRDGFAQLLHAEWTKFRTVRAWVIGVSVAGLMLVLFSFLVAQGSHSSNCTSDSTGNDQVCTGAPALPVGPGGEAVTDSYYFVNQTLTGDGTITARVTSLTGVRETGAATQGGEGGSSSAADTTPDLEPWSKAGLLITASTDPGSAYVAIMATGANGVRMQYDYTHDIAGIPGAPSTASPRWLRLTRHAATVTGYDSTDGVHWTKVGVARFAEAPSAVPAGLFATSPDHVKVTTHLFGGSACVAIHAAGSADAGSPSAGAGSPSPACEGSGPTQATGVFDQLSLEGSWSAAGGGWRGNAVTNSADTEPFGTGSYEQSDATLTVSGSGDIAPSVKGAGPGGNAIEDTLLGAFAAMIVVTVLAALFMTGEYRRGLIRTTMTASPRRTRVLAAKAVVIGAVTFVAALTGAIIAVLLGEHLLRANGNYIFPTSTGTKIQVVAGTAALLAVTAVAALALGSVLRRSAGAVTAVIVLILVPYILSVSSALPVGAANWLLRLTPAAAFAIQQSTPQYHQVIANYTPANGYYPLPPVAGLAVLCAYTVGTLAVAGYLLRRRDV